MCTVEFELNCFIIHMYVSLSSRSSSQSHLGALNYTVRSPVGIVGQITPWNLPLYLMTFKIAPAIAAGNCVVCKPSEFTSVTAWKLCSLFIEAGTCISYVIYFSQTVISCASLEWCLC